MAWDISRREALGYAALGVATVGCRGLLGTASAWNLKLTVVEEGAAPESRQFAATLARSGVTKDIIQVDRSLNSLLYELDGATGYIAGLTSDPVEMIAGQLLAERGARARLNWRHSYVAEQWRHEIQGAPRLLKGAATAWPAAMALQVRDILGGKSRGFDNVCKSGFCALPSGSPGMLVSWVYEVGGNLS